MRRALSMGLCFSLVTIAAAAHAEEPKKIPQTPATASAPQPAQPQAQPAAPAQPAQPQAPAPAPATQVTPPTPMVSAMQPLPAPQLATAPATQAASTATAEERPRVKVQLRADDPGATVERRVGTLTPSGLPLAELSIGSVGQWEQQCVAPCELPLDSRYTYRISGDGLVPSSSFTLPADHDHVQVDAKMGSQVGRFSGIALTGIGAGALALGGAALIASPILEANDVGSKGFRTGVLAGGVGVAGAGVIALAAGLYLWVTNSTQIHEQTAAASPTKVRVTPGGFVF